MVGTGRIIVDQGIANSYLSLGWRALSSLAFHPESVNQSSAMSRPLQPSSKPAASSKRPPAPSSSRVSDREPGDKPKLFGGSPAQRIVFLDDLLSLFHRKGSKSGYILMKDVSEHLLTQSPLSDSNLYRKQYGNLNQIFLLEDFTQIFHIEKECIRLQNEESLRQSDLNPQQLKLALALRRSERLHHCLTMKRIGENECARCRKSYRELCSQLIQCRMHTGQRVDNGSSIVYSCCGKGPNTPCVDSVHLPAFDWSRASDETEQEIEKCQIQYQTDVINLVYQPANRDSDSKMDT